MSMLCRLRTRRHTAVMKTTTTGPVSRPEQQHHRNVNPAEERAAVHVEQRAVAPDFFDRKIPCTHCRIAIVVIQLVIHSEITDSHILLRFFDHVVLHLAVSSIVISCWLVQIELRGTDLIDEHKIAGVSLWIADGTGNAFREVDDIARFDLRSEETTSE